MTQCEDLLNITMIVVLIFAIYILTKDFVKLPFTGSNQHTSDLNEIDAQIRELRKQLRSNNEKMQYKLQKLYLDRAKTLNDIRLSRQKNIPVSKFPSNVKRNLSTNDRLKKLMEQRMRRNTTDRSGDLSTGYNNEYAKIIRGEGFMNGEYRNEHTY